MFKLKQSKQDFKDHFCKRLKAVPKERQETTTDCGVSGYTPNDFFDFFNFLYACSF